MKESICFDIGMRIGGKSELDLGCKKVRGKLLV